MKGQIFFSNTLNRGANTPLIQCQNCQLGAGIYETPRAPHSKNCLNITPKITVLMCAVKSNPHGLANATKPMKCTVAPNVLTNITFSNLRPPFLLDVGCATGAFLVAMRQTGWQVQGVELVDYAAEYAFSVKNKS